MGNRMRPKAPESDGASPTGSTRAPETGAPPPITPAEAAFAAKLFPLIPTPRAAQRFVACYGELKRTMRPANAFGSAAPIPLVQGVGAGRDGTQRGGGADIGGSVSGAHANGADPAGSEEDYATVMLLLAIRIATPEVADLLFPVLLRAAAVRSGCVPVLRRCASLAPGMASLNMVQGILTPLLAEMEDRLTDAAFAVWVPRVWRYSFGANRSCRSKDVAGGRPKISPCHSANAA